MPHTKILIAEDEGAVAEYLQSMLTKMGHKEPAVIKTAKAVF